MTKDCDLVDVFKWADMNSDAEKEGDNISNDNFAHNGSENKPSIKVECSKSVTLTTNDALLGVPRLENNSV